MQLFPIHPTYGVKAAPAQPFTVEFAVCTFVNGQPFVVRVAWKSFEPEIE